MLYGLETMNEVEATDNLWEDVTHVHPEIKEFRDWESRKKTAIYIVYTFAIISCILAGIGLAIDSTITLIIGWVFGAIATLFAFIEWI